MSIEASVFITATFNTEDSAKEAVKKLKKSLRKNNYDLGTSLNEINPYENHEAYKDHTINIEETGRKKEKIKINGYTYVSDQPIWFTKSLSELGANRIYISAAYDDHLENFYFINGEEVRKKDFYGEKPKKPLSDKDIEINKNLFLPEGRATVKAKLISEWSYGDIYESTALELQTIEGEKFYHIGKGKLIDIFYNPEKKDYDKDIIVQFDAAFERGKIDKKYSSFAKRPTKISIYKEKSD